MLTQTLTKDNIIIEIHADEDPEDPRKSFDNVGVMACSHKRYTLGDKQISTQEEYDEIIKKCVVYRNLYLLDHSGLRMQTYSFNDPWDSGEVGVIYVTREAIKKAFGDKGKPRHKRLIDIIENEVKTFNDYLSGNVYGYIVKKVSACGQCTQVTEEILDSCFGYYGDHGSSGLYEAIKGSGYDIKEFTEVNIQ